MGVEIAGYDIEDPLPLLGMSVWNLIVLALMLVIGFMVIRIISWVIKRSFRRMGVEEILAEFAVRILRLVLYVFLFGAVLGIMGLQLGSAFLGASVVLGLVLGMALGDSISNVAAGFMIAMTKPFRKGDFVTINGESGEVKSVGISITEIDTIDNKHVIVPNKAVWAGNIVNFTRNKRRRVDMEIGVGYDEDLDNVIRTIQKLVRSHPKVMKDPEPQVEVKDFGDSAVILVIRPWSKTEDYWDVFFDIKKGLKSRFDKVGIKIPYPQMDVHVKGK